MQISRELLTDSFLQSEHFFLDFAFLVISSLVCKSCCALIQLLTLMMWLTIRFTPMFKNNQAQDRDVAAKLRLVQRLAYSYDSLR